MYLYVFELDIPAPDIIPCFEAHATLRIENHKDTRIVVSQQCAVAYQSIVIV